MLLPRTPSRRSSHFPLRCPREEVFGFLVEALRFHRLILAQGAWPRSDSGVVYCSNSGPTGPVICKSSYNNLREPDFCEVGCIKLSLAQPARHLEQREGEHQ